MVQAWTRVRQRLWPEADFRRLWLGQTVSEFGSLLGALPLVALLALDASPAQIGVLAALESLPRLLLGLFAGVWVDRVRRRPLLLAADLGRAGLLAVAAWLALAGRLTLVWLYAVAFAVGALTTLFAVAFDAYVPRLVAREQLVAANSRLGASASLAESLAPGLGGLLAQLFSAPALLLADGLSFLVSASQIWAIRRPEPPVTGSPLDHRPARARETGPAGALAGIGADLLGGLAYLALHPLLGPLAGSAALRSFFGAFFGALYLWYGLRLLGLSPALVGLTVGAGGIGALLGTLAARRLIGALGFGRGLVWSVAASALLSLLIPLARGPVWTAAALLIVAQVLGDVALTLFFIGERSLRQAVTEDGRLGRVNAAFQFMNGGAHSLGLLAGGLLGQTLGVRPALYLAVGGSLLAALWLSRSPVRRLETLASRDPDPAPD